MLSKLSKYDRILILIIILAAGSFLSQYRSFADNQFQPLKTTIPPVIDGVLDDQAWKNAQKVTGFKTYSPDYGKDMSVNTEAYLAYDEGNLYFAFKCYEHEPDKIRANVTGRDKITGDDFVCINLDTFGDQQTLTCFYVNPLGIQGDSKATRNNEDFKFDAVWESAGLIDKDGYNVEICIPLKSIRYADHNPTEMRLTLQRNMILRMEYGTYPPLDPAKGQDFIIQGSPVLYEGLKHYTLLEVLPAYTYSHKETIDQGSLIPEERKGNISLNTKYGITRNLILDGTYNPDFSQIEADAGQVDVNLRYQLYYPETRPFFLEGNESFQVATGPTIIHTRQIIDPIVGTKLTGKIVEGQTIAALYAMDELDPRQYQDRKYAHFGILRYKGDVGSGGYIGALAANKEMSGHYNRVAAVDGQLRVTGSSSLSFIGSYSHTRDGAASINEGGHVMMLNFNNHDRNFNYGVYAENISNNYYAEMGQMYRTGYVEFGGFFNPRFYPDSSIFLNISPQISTNHLRDNQSGMWENSYSGHVNYLLINRISGCAGYEKRTEVFQARKFNADYMHTSLSARITRIFSIGMSGSYRNAIYYSEDPYPGYSWGGNLNVSYQPLPNIDLSLAYTYNDFYRKSDNEKIYDYSITRFRSTYQFNKYLFFRGVVEYNNYRKRLFTDFLASFTYIPGTVLYLGYGSIYQKVQWENEQYNPSRRFLETKRGFFLKVSYLWRA